MSFSIFFHFSSYTQNTADFLPNPKLTMLKFFEFAFFVFHLIRQCATINWFTPAVAGLSLFHINDVSSSSRASCSLTSSLPPGAWDADSHFPPLKCPRSMVCDQKCVVPDSATSPRWWHIRNVDFWKVENFSHDELSVRYDPTVKSKKKRVNLTWWNSANMNGFRLKIISQRLSKILSSKYLITNEIYRFKIWEKSILPIMAHIRRLPFGAGFGYCCQSYADRLRPLLADRLPILGGMWFLKREIIEHEFACPAVFFPMLKHVTFARANRTRHRG